ncbi:hypothetical protein [Microbacterium sp. CPCC 204701]|uniref:hypothetical protein n=1 Tax=Microbacterium sp. CPCC 204701 TaxID=2493084 RepID=UPI000FDBD0CD|nr:hypothetical protein [Microbacterium sp. CPCC 204701]
MTARSRSLAAGLGLALLAAGILTGCATPAGSGPSPSATTDDSMPDSDVSAAWLDNGRMVGVVTLGSSTCVPTAGDVAFADGVLQVELVEPQQATACTHDLVPRATIVALPEGVDPTQELEIRVTGEGYQGDTDLDGVAGLDPSSETDYLPSAGWADDGQLVILSWGSSSCAPTLESAEVTSPTEVTVTFAALPADQVCTMDMAPRGAVAQVPDDSALDDDAEVLAILTGGEFDNVRVPIIGHD